MSGSSDRENLRGSLVVKGGRFPTYGGFAKRNVGNLPPERAAALRRPALLREAKETKAQQERERGSEGDVGCRLRVEALRCWYFQGVEGVRGERGCAPSLIPTFGRVSSRTSVEKLARCAPLYRDTWSHRNLKSRARQKPTYNYNLLIWQVLILMPLSCRFRMMGHSLSTPDRLSQV